MLKKRLPAAEKPSDAVLLYRRDTGRVVEANEAALSNYNNLIEVRKQIKNLTDIEETCKSELQMFMQDAAELQYDGRTLASWRNAKETEKLNIKSLQENDATIYKKYLKPFPGSRRFLIK